MTNPPSLHKLVTALGGSVSASASQSDHVYAVAPPPSVHSPMLQQVFQQCADEILGVRGMLLVTGEGMVVASTMPETIDTLAIAAIAAPWLGIADRVAWSVTLGPTEESLIRTADGLCSLRSVQSYILMTLLDSHANLGMFWVHVPAVEQVVMHTLAGIDPLA